MEGKCTRGTKHVEIAGRMEWRISSSFQDSRNLISSVFEWKEEEGGREGESGKWGMERVRYCGIAIKEIDETDPRS